MCEENEPTLLMGQRHIIGLQKLAVHLLLDKLLHPAPMAFQGLAPVKVASIMEL